MPGSKTPMMKKRSRPRMMRKRPGRLKSLRKSSRIRRILMILMLRTSRWKKKTAKMMRMIARLMSSPGLV
jgi:hypothetical protein